MASTWRLPVKRGKGGKDAERGKHEDKGTRKGDKGSLMMMKSRYHKVAGVLVSLYFFFFIYLLTYLFSLFFVSFFLLVIYFIIFRCTQERQH